MQANAAFTGFYSMALRDILPCLTGQEVKVFVALASYVNELGTCWPGVRELSVVTTFPPQIVSDLLKSLQEKDLVVFLRQSERDPLTGKMRADVYGLNPAIVLISNPAAWNENRLTHVSMPESGFPVKSAQPDRITEAESEKQMQRSRITALEGAASQQDPNAPHQPNTSPGVTIRRAERAASQQATPRQPSAAPYLPPSSAPPPSQNWRELSFQEATAANAVRRQVADMSADTVRSLIIRFGVEQVYAAVSSYKDRSAKHPILRPTGWIIRNLESGARK